MTLIYDEFGSPDTVWSRMTDSLIDAGGGVIFQFYFHLATIGTLTKKIAAVYSFNPVWTLPWKLRTNPFLRNHKSLTFDNCLVLFYLFVFVFGFGLAEKLLCVTMRRRFVVG